jgi:hypothetical protein
MKRLIVAGGILASALTIAALAAVIQSAGATTAVVANGTLTCSAAKGTVTFSPPLTEDGTSTATLNYSPHKCTSTATNIPVKDVNSGGDTVIARVPPGGPLVKITNTWAASSVPVANTKISIKSWSFVANKAGNESIVILGTAKGSFAGPSKVTLNSNTPSKTFQAELQKGGVPNLTFTSGTANVG